MKKLLYIRLLCLGFLFSGISNHLLASSIHEFGLAHICGSCEEKKIRAKENFTASLALHPLLIEQICKRISPSKQIPALQSFVAAQLDQQSQDIYNNEVAARVAICMRNKRIVEGCRSTGEFAGCMISAVGNLISAGAVGGIVGGAFVVGHGVTNHGFAYFRDENQANRIACGAAIGFYGGVIFTPYDRGIIAVGKDIGGCAGNLVGKAIVGAIDRDDSFGKEASCTLM